MLKKILAVLSQSSFQNLLLLMLGVGTVFAVYRQRETNNLIQQSTVEQVALIDKLISDEKIHLLTSKELLQELRAENNQLLLRQNSIGQGSNWSLITGLTVLISSLTAILFTVGSIKKPASISVKTSLEKSPISDVPYDEHMFSWILDNGMQKSSGSLDLEKAQLWKQILEHANELGEKKPLLIEAINELLEYNLNEDNSPQAKQDSLYESFDEIKSRLSREIDRLNNQSISNMLFGFTLALGLIFYHGYTVFYSPIKNVDLSSLWHLLLPRVIVTASALTIFIYFMRLYKSNIADVKYYQNEMTNIEMKLASTRLALISPEKAISDMLVKDFTSVERNAVITKEQTSFELERLRTENETQKDFLAKVMDLLGSKK